jgi:hypothetical protein
MYQQGRHKKIRAALITSTRPPVLLPAQPHGGTFGLVSPGGSVKSFAGTGRADHRISPDSAGIPHSHRHGS